MSPWKDGFLATGFVNAAEQNTVDVIVYVQKCGKKKYESRSSKFGKGRRDKIKERRRIDIAGR